MLALGLGVGVALAAGCERTQAGESATLRRAQEAVRAGSNAPEGAAGGAQEARLRALEAVVADLSPLTSSEDPDRRALALGLLAEIAAARSQAHELEGRGAAAALRSDLTRLLSGVDSAERDAARAQARTLDPRPAIERVEAAAAEDRARLEATRAAAERLAEEAEAVEADAAAAAERRLAAAAREASLVDAAFLVGGDERHRKLEEAAEARAAADAAASKEREAGIRLGQIEREAELARTRSELAAEGVERMDRAGREFADAGAEAAAVASEARQAATGGAGATRDAAASLEGAFRARVLGPLDAAAAAAGEATGHLERGQADSVQVAASRLTELDASVAAAEAAASFAAGLDAVATRLSAVDPAAGSGVTALAEGLREEAARRRGSAGELLTSARGALEQTPEGDPAAETLRGVATRLGALLQQQG